MESLKEIEKDIIKKTSKSERIVHGIWGVDCFFNPANNGRVFDYKFLVTQTTGQGCAYSMNLDYSREYLRKYIGKDFTDCSIDDIAIRVALFDSIYWNVLKPEKYIEKSMKGTSDEKLKWRTNIIIDEAKKLLGDLKDKRIVNVGVVGDILKSFSEEGSSVIGTDFDTEIVGSLLFGKINVVHGSNTLREIANSDLAIVTGMTITTQTIDDIIECCKENNVKLIVFAETGANLAGYYVNNGVDVYISEQFPFYIFNGISLIDICYPNE